MLYSERKRLKTLEDREANGESLWSAIVPKQLRTKLYRVISGYGWAANEFHPDFGIKQIRKLADDIFADGRGEAEQDLLIYLDYCDDSIVPDILESFYIAINHYDMERSSPLGADEAFCKDINNLLQSYRVSYSLESGQIIEFESRELHVEIVIPTLMLISKLGWAEVEKSYQDALKEMSGGDPGNAITDATTALQEALRKLGCKGGDFASLLKSTKEMLLKGFDSKYIDSIDSLVKWASASRSNRGDSHKVTEAEKEDAWFVIHVVGILILRLSKK